MQTRTGGIALGVLGLVLTGCASAGSNADDPVPTMSVRPTPSASPTASGFEVSAKPSEQQTSPTGKASTTESAKPAPATTSAPAQSPAETKAADLTKPPMSYDQAVAYLAEARNAGAEEQKLEVFRTSEDIYCLLSSEYFDPACELPQGAGIKDPDACGNAMSNRVGRIEVTRKGARAICNTDTIRDSVPETVESLGIVTQGGLECAVADIGVTCVHSGDHVGFFLGLQSYGVFR